MEQRVCELCGQATEYRTGNKEGKPWAGYFCQNQNCKHVQWIKLHTATPKPAPKPQAPAPQVSKPVGKDDFNETKQENSLMMCAADIVVAQIGAGVPHAATNPGITAVRLFWELKEGLVKKPPVVVEQDWPEEPINEVG